jgi:hypothetical protein
VWLRLADNEPPLVEVDLHGDPTGRAVIDLLVGSGLVPEPARRHCRSRGPASRSTSNGPSCGEGIPDLAALCTPGFFYATGTGRPEDSNHARSVGAGSVVAWGQRINDTYARSSCS